MSAFSNENLKDDLHYGPDCVGFEPALTYAITNNGGTKTVKVTDTSVYPEDSGLQKVLFHVIDTNGNEKHGEITPSEDENPSEATISVVGLVMVGLAIKATVISDLGCKADLGVYDLDGKTGTGVIENASKQGKRF